MTWLANLIPPPESREPVTTPAFYRDILSPLLCYYATAVLVLTPNTRAIRLAVLPLSLWTLFNGATRLDIVKTYNNEALAYLNQGLVVTYTLLGMRLIVWSLQKDVYWRVKTRQEATPEFYSAKPSTFSTKKVFVDAFDLCSNVRGCGWNWSQYLQIPAESRSTSSLTAFTASTLASAIIHTAMFDIFQYIIQWIVPATRDPVKGGSIFEPNLPPLLRYSRSSFLVFLVGMAAYGVLRVGYDLATLVGVLLFRQDTSLWPPFFQAPWLSVSLTEFWAKRWHQTFRHCFISLGGKPLSLVFGRAGGVIGAFIVSGILHVFGHWGMGRGTNWVLVGGFFVVNGIGIILEHVWRYRTGHRVGGWLGRIWTILWLIGWGHMLIEAWSTSGLFGSVFTPRRYRLTTYVLRPLS